MVEFGSFTARMTSANMGQGNCYPVWALRALEREYAIKELASCHIASARQWIIISGLWIYGEALKARPLEESDVRATRGGPLYNGKVGLCRERWEFWKLRFSKVKDEVDEEVAEMVQQALSEMERVHHHG